MITFNFLDKDSYEDFHIILTETPRIPMPQRNVEYINITGRSGSYTVDSGTYNDITISLSCTVISDNLIESANKIKEWLSQGQGKLSLSSDPNKYYIAQVVNKFDIVEAIDNWGEFVIVFNCKPFKYSSQNNIIFVENHENNATKIIYNPGTVESEPIIKIIGSGDFEMKINRNQSIIIKDVVENVVVNSIYRDCYKCSKNTEEIESLMNHKMIGQFPLFKPQNNKIEILTLKGTFDSAEIMPNWRWI